MKNKNIWGIILIIFGILIGLSELNIVNFNIFFNGWWTLFIIVPCIIQILNKKHDTENYIFLMIGILLLLESWQVISFEAILNLVFPIILIGFGISLTLKNSGKDDYSNEVFATFKNSNIDMSNEKFKSIKQNSIFATTVINLSNSKFKNESIESVNIFGKTKIIVDKDTEVLINSLNIFGSSKKKSTNENTSKKLIVNSTCLFGGIEIE